MTAPEENLAPDVSPADLKSVWTTLQDIRAHGKPGEATAMDTRALEQICSPGANVGAVWARTLMLQILNYVVPGWARRADMGKVFEVAARFPMRLMEPGVEYEEPPFDVQEFMKQIAAP